MVSYNSEEKMVQKSPIAVFFYEQSKEALIDAINVFEQVDFVSQRLVDHANKWSVSSFKSKFRAYVLSCFEKKCREI